MTMIRKALSVVLLLALSLPAIQKSYHALEDHVGVHCQEDIPNHFHSREYQCSFDNFLLLPHDLRTPQILVDPIFASFANIVIDVEQVYFSNKTLYKHLRAPPSPSTSLV